MRITAEISMYPLHESFIGDIRAFILRLRDMDGIEVVTNQMSTQVRGEFDQVTGAINTCIRDSMQRANNVVFVAKYLNADLDIAHSPNIEPAD